MKPVWMEDWLKANQMISRLKTDGGNQALFTLKALEEQGYLDSIKEEGELPSVQQEFELNLFYPQDAMLFTFGSIYTLL